MYIPLASEHCVFSADVNYSLPLCYTRSGCITDREMINGVTAINVYTSHLGRGEEGGRERGGEGMEGEGGGRDGDN